MRVAHFVQRYPPALGGSEAYFARLSASLARAGHRVTVFTTTADDLESFWSARGRTLPSGTSEAGGVQVRRYPLLCWPGRRYALKALSLVPSASWQCLTQPCNPVAWGMWRDAGRTDERFDVAHATALPYAWPIACARRLARRLGVPFLVTPFVHTGDPDARRDRTRRAYTRRPLLGLLRDADAVFVQTASEAELLRRHGVADRKIVMQGLGVDPAECAGGDRDAARRRWKVDADEVVIGHLANLSVEKGTVDLLRALARLWQQGRRLRLVLAGPEMPNFRSFWASFPSAGQVIRFGRLTDTERRDFFAGLDVFALPSRSDSFGLVLLEAWANGAPCVAYRAGGVADVVDHGRDGLLVRCGDLAGLAAAIDALAGDAGLRRRYGERGRARALADFRWEPKLALVERVYQRLAAGEAP